MKSLLILIGVIAVAAVLSVTVPVKDGRPLVNLKALQEAALDQAAQLRGEVENELPREPTQIYRWRGSNGKWQFGQVPPTGVEAELVTPEPARIVPSEEFKQGKY